MTAASVPLLLGLDLGTSYLKAGLFDARGHLHGLGRRRVEITAGTFSHELNPATFWQMLQGAIEQALEDAGALPNAVQGISYASQVNSFILLDEHDAPLTPIILWPSVPPQSAGDRVHRLWDFPEFHGTTGLNMQSEEFAPYKFEYLRVRHPDLWRRVRRILTLCDYLLWKLTGATRIDFASAGMSGLFNLSTGAWWPRALQHLDLDPKLLSAPIPPGVVIGNLLASTGLPLQPGTPVASGALDHYCAALGAGAGQVAPASLSLGTVSACLRVHAEPGLGTSDILGRGADPGECWAMAYTNHGVSLFETWQRQYAPQRPIQDLVEEALARPTCNDLSEIDHAASPADWIRELGPARATPDAMRLLVDLVARELNHIVQRCFGATAPERLVVTGGAAGNARFLHFLTQTLGCPLLTTTTQECAARGAAHLAARALHWPKFQK